MIAHPLKAVFVHIPKTAGQSVEQIFLSLLGLDQQSRPALLLREKRDYEQGPPRLSHLTAHEYTQHGFLSEQQFDEFFSFAFVRNPWSRVQSFYSYLKFDEKMSFAQFVLDELQEQIQSEKNGWFVKPQAEYILDSNNAQLVDFVGRFENLQTDFDQVMKQLGLPKAELPVTNYSLRMISDVERSNTYDSSTIDKVAQLYARDIDLFGYQPI